MQSASFPDNEAARLEELLRYELLDTEDEEALDELTELASDICGVPISLISLVDADRQWFKSRVGLDAKETEREVAFCSHAILQEEIFEVPNALEDERFSDNPLVTDSPDIRFYAGAPLVTKGGFALGTLCVIDREPRQLDDAQRKALKTLSRQVVRQLELRLQYRRLERMQVEREKFYAILAHDLRSPFSGVVGLARVLKDAAGALPPEKIIEISEQILGSSLSLFQLLDEILQWSQTRLGTTDCDIHEYLLKDLFSGSLEILKQALELKGICLEDNVLEGQSVRADQTLTKTVIRNLLSNAIKYSSSGSKIRVSSYQEGSDSVLRIEDSGPGIPQEKVASLFHQGVKSSLGTLGEEGFGLGLRLCHDFMSMQTGQLRLDVKYTEGAALEIVLPSA